MTRIYKSIAFAVVTAVVAVGATWAFFNDVETSRANVLIAGSIDLTVDSFGAKYNGQDIQGTTWTARDLTTEKFFTLQDVKPGDHGRRHISLHADDNQAWACLLLANKSDLENGVTDPETDAGDPPGEPGELSGNIEAFAWQDNDSDLNYEPGSGEVPLPINGVLAESFFDVFYSVSIADSMSGTPPLEPTGPAATRNISLAWCAGQMTVNHGTGAISCDGSAVSDVSQTDSFSADVVLYAEEHRNNPDFECKDVVLAP